jgi:EGF-like domain
MSLAAVGQSASAADSHSVSRCSSYEPLVLTILLILGIYYSRTVQDCVEVNARYILKFNSFFFHWSYFHFHCQFECTNEADVSVLERITPDSFQSSLIWLRKAGYCNRLRVACSFFCADHDACSSSPCLNGGTCQTTNSDRSEYTCLCADSVEGSRCESELNTQVDCLFTNEIIKYAIFTEKYVGPLFFYSPFV